MVASSYGSAFCTGSIQRRITPPRSGNCAANSVNSGNRAKTVTFSTKSVSQVAFGAPAGVVRLAITGLRLIWMRTVRMVAKAMPM